MGFSQHLLGSFPVSRRIAPEQHPRVPVAHTGLVTAVRQPFGEFERVFVVALSIFLVACGRGRHAGEALVQAVGESDYAQAGNSPSPRMVSPTCNSTHAPTR